MKLNDAVFGLLLFALGAAVLLSVQGFPKIPGQPVGPALFPGLVAAGLCVAGLLLVVRGWRERATQPWLAWDAWVRSPRHALALAVLLGSIAFYIAVADWLGFLPTAIIILYALLRVLGVPAGRSAIIAVIATLVVHFAFYKLLRVPLPWGVLTRGRLVTGALAQAFAMVFEPATLLAILLSAFFGLFVGAIPGLTATMATALLVPVTFFMPPIPAIATMVTATAMAIFSGDVPGCLLRIPGTPASAAYTDEAFAMTRKGQAELALGAGLVFSAVGGLFGTAVLIVAAPTLAEFALNFSSFEYFWLVLLGLTCAVFITSDQPVKGIVTLLLGLLVACVGLGNPAGFPRFTFGNAEMTGGIGMIAMMIGMFAISEVIRYVVDTSPPAEMVVEKVGNVLAGQWALAKKYPVQILRGSTLGTAVGALPGAGADIAAWMSYAMSKKFSKEPEKFGTGHVEGIVESGAANNSALAGAWIPALVFGIPGDSITAIVIGVLYMKNMNPGPTLFTTNPQNIYAVFLLFILANIIMIPLGILCIKAAKRILLVPRNVLMPLIVLFCIVGTFAINNSAFEVGVMLVAGVVAYILEANRFPIAPAILGVVLGGMLEENFITSMIKSDGSLAAFVSRPIAAGLALVTVLVWFLPPVVRLVRRRRGVVAAG